MSVIVHVGQQKTGSTSIQYWLRDHEELLSEHGIRFPRGWCRLNNHHELGLTLTRLERLTSPRTRANEWRGPGWRSFVLAQIASDLKHHRDETTLLSNEMLGMLRYDDEVDQLRRLVGDAHIILYLRNPPDFLASLAAQFEKNGQGTSADPDAFNYVEPDSWLVDYDAVVSLWRRGFSRVSVVSYDEALAEFGSVIPSFAELLGLPWSPAVADPYPWLNRQHGPTPRVEGNRARGLLFGERSEADAVDIQLSDESVDLTDLVG